MAKSQQLQIRVTPSAKARLKKLARSAGQDVSSYVLARALPSLGLRFAALVRSLGDTDNHRYVLAELNDHLSALAPIEFRESIQFADVDGLSAFLANYVAAMVEQAAYAKGVAAPLWASQVTPLERPHFATPMVGLRLHLLHASPIPFKKRNIFVDSALGARV